MLDPSGKLSKICLALPEVTSNSFGLQNEHIDFKVRGKSFASLLNNHHGDGRLAIWCKSSLAIQTMLVAEDPIRFFVPPYLGPRGWVGVRVDVGTIDWAQVEDVLVEAFRLQAPKRLLKELSD